MEAWLRSANGLEGQQAVIELPVTVGTQGNKVIDPADFGNSGFIGERPNRLDFVMFAETDGLRVMLRGDRLRQLRLANNYTHEHLAELLDLSVHMIARYESGETDPASAVVVRIANLFKVSTDYLLGQADDPLSYIEMGGLSVQERKVLAALRQGQLLEALRAVLCEEYSETKTNPPDFR